MQVVVESIRIPCSDEQVILGTFFRPPSPSPPEYVAVVFPGVGIPADYYHTLAHWFASAGRPTLIFDYRGIGHSATTCVKNSKVSFRQWASKDCAGALNAARSNYLAAPIVGIAHSFGGFLVGCAEGGQGLLSSAVMLGPHTGFPGDYSPSLRPMMKIAWHKLMPMATRLLGYFPGRLTGLPADLPALIALQWAGRFRPDIWEDLRQSPVSPGDSYDDLRLRMETLRIPILGVRASDDAFSTDVAARRLLRCYQNSHSLIVCIEPRVHGMRRLGHMRYLSSRIRATWSRIDRWIVTSISGRSAARTIAEAEPRPVSPQ